MQRTCHNTWCNHAFTITDADLAFYEKVSPVFNGKKELIPPPTLCPECRLQRRLTWRNDRTLYQRSCDKSGKSLITMFAPDAPVTVYDKDIWWSDAWDAMAFGRPFDATRPFFSQFIDVLHTAPHVHVMTVDSENSLYTNYNFQNRNCYLCFAGNFAVDCLYCYNAEKCRTCTDCFFTFECERCYECVQASNCYNALYALHCRNCSDSAFLEDCANLKHCMFCTNLNNREYCIYNVQYPQEEYEKRTKEFRIAGYGHLQELLSAWEVRRRKAVKRASHNVMAEQCTGEYINQSKNCHDCYLLAKGCEDCRYVLNGFPGLKDAMDCTYCGEPGAEGVYECMASGGTIAGTLFGDLCLNSSGLLYCHSVLNSKNCFGCCNMRNAEYCILNTQYSKEEYEVIVPKIIEQMKVDGTYGEFFPTEMSPFVYNETVAQEYFPLTKEEALTRGWRWKDQVDEVSKVDRVIPASQLPDAIDQIPDDITNWAIECEMTKRPFKIIKQELEFCRQMQLAVPRLHPDERHRRRMALRNPRKLWQRTCMKCGKEMETTYSPERPEIVYCESCYLAEVY